MSARPLSPEARKLLKKPPSYRQGWKDADMMLKRLSLWFCCSVAFYSGFQRKTSKSNIKVFRYCEGFQDRLAKEAKRKGTKLSENGFIPQEFIGK